MMEALRTFVSHPWVGLMVATVMLLSGLSEGWDTLQEDLTNADLKTHHGMIVYGFYAMLKSIPEVFDGLERIAK